LNIPAGLSALNDICYPKNSNSGPKPNKLGTYELVAFTRLEYENSENHETAFNKIERRIPGIFTRIGFLDREAVV